MPKKAIVLLVLIGAWTMWTIGGALWGAPALREYLGSDTIRISLPTGPDDYIAFTTTFLVILPTLIGLFISGALVVWSGLGVILTLHRMTK